MVLLGKCNKDNTNVWQPEKKGTPSLVFVQHLNNNTDQVFFKNLTISLGNVLPLVILAKLAQLKNKKKKTK